MEYGKSKVDVSWDEFRMELDKAYYAGMDKGWNACMECDVYPNYGMYPMPTWFVKRFKEAERKAKEKEDADSLFNGEKEETTAIIVMMKKSRNGTISTRIMQEGKEGIMNSWAVAAAAYLLIECCISNVPEMGKVLSEYMDKPYMERRIILKSVLETMENKEKEIKEKANGN